MARLTPRLRLVAGYAIAMIVTVSLVSAVTFALFQRSLARDLHARISHDVEQVSEVLAVRGIAAFLTTPGAELLEGESARMSVIDDRGRVVAGRPLESAPTVRLHVIAPGNRTYVVGATAQSSSAEALATRRLGLLLLLSPVVALVLAGLAGIYLADRALRPVEEAYERERRFVADAAHELRTPVTILRLSVEELRAQPGKVEEAQLEDIAIEVARLGKLVQELLELSRLQRGSRDVRGPVDVRDIVESMADRFRPLAESRGLDLRTELPADSPLALASRDGVERVLTVLLDNAISYTPAGSITVGVRNGQRVRVDVSDSGPGISADRRAQIFEPFVSTGPARARDDGGGSGLGLAIAKETARAMGADLSVESKTNAGSTFTLLLDPA